jgi:sugar phosphate isomerase/epimerase
MPQQITVSTVAYDGYPLKRAVDEIARLGFPLVEPAYIKGYMAFEESDFEEAGSQAVSRLMQDAGVSALAVSAHMDIGHTDSIAMLARRIRFTAGIGARFTITNATTTDKRDALMRTLEANQALAEDLGIVIALENPGHGPTNLMTDGASGAALIQSIGMDCVRMNYDTSNALTCTEGAVRPEIDVAAALPHAVHVHFKDVIRRQDTWEYVALGAGEIDYDIINAALAALPGIPITIELPLRLRRRFHQDPVRADDLVPLDRIGAAIMQSWRRVFQSG